MPLPLLEMPPQTPSDEVDEEILEIFVEEMGEVMEDVITNFEQWRNNATDQEALQTLRRAFHTMKGSGRLVGAAVIGEVGWAYENMLNRVLDNSIQRSQMLIDLLKKVDSDLMQKLIGEFQEGTDADYPTALLVSQVHHFTETKGAELGEFEGQGAAASTASSADEPDTVAIAETGDELGDLQLDSVEDFNFDELGELDSSDLGELGELNEHDLLADISSAEMNDTLAGLEAEFTQANFSSPSIYDEEEDEDELEARKALQAIFQEEALEHLNELKSFLFKCHQYPPCVFNEDVVRVLHTLNGSARSVGLFNIATLAAPMEKYARLSLDKRWIAKKEVLSLLIESGKYFEKTLQSGKNEADATQENLLAQWQELLDNANMACNTVDEDEELGVVPSSFHNTISEPQKPQSSPIATEPKPAIPTAAQDSGAAPAQNAEAADEFMEIFLEEAEEILETCQSLLGRWQASPNSMPLLKELQRELHTLKGGSRMVGISAMGDLSHQLESVLTKIVEGNAQSNPVLQSLVQQSVDELASMLELVRTGGGLTPATRLIAQIGQALEGGEIDDTPIPSANQKPKNADNQEAEPPAVQTPEVPQEGTGIEAEERVRVRATLIDKLTNLAGELSISRAHMEQQQGSVKLNLSEMEQTVLRLKDQLRRLEIETEAQIISHFGQVGSGPDEEEFDPLEMDRFSVLQQLSRALMETVSDLLSIEENLKNLTRHSDSLLIQQSRIGAELQDGIMRTRMIPFSQISPRLQRIARLTARELHKQVNFAINDDSIEFERTVLNRIVAPLEHMLRNAIGHGIEEPEVRAKLGKPAAATVGIELLREGAELILRLKDDGAGINLEAIRKKAVERGLLKPKQAATDEELLQFILEPAFSTATTVTQVSGRGVGMDIANSEIKQLGGTLLIETERGKGTTFEIRLPLSLTISNALLVHLGEETLAVPLHNVDAVMRVPRSELHLDSTEIHQYRYMDQDYRIAHLGDLLGFGRGSVDSSLLPILLVRSAEHRVALAVDGIEGSREVVVKTVGPQLSGIRWMAGATILGDGRVVIILDVLALLRSHAKMPAMLQPVYQDMVEEKPAATIMVVDDSITVRKVTARLLKRQGMEVLTAKDGVDAFSQLQETIPDLMLLDVEMPRMDGFELATQIRNNEELRHLPIIMITSRTGFKHRERAKKIGINRHLGKPFNETELLENINSLLEEKAAEQ